MVYWLTAKLVQEPSVPGNVILGNALSMLKFFSIFAASLCVLYFMKGMLQVPNTAVYFAEKTPSVATVIYERGIPRRKNTTAEICQDQRLNMICFVCNQQLSLRLVFTIRFSYLAQILPFKFIASVTCVLNSSWWKNILFSSHSIQMSWMCIHRSIGLSDYFRWVTSSEIRTMQVICGGVLTGAILAEFTGNTQIMLILG